MYDNLQDVTSDDVEFFDDNMVGIAFDGSPFYDFFVKYELDLDVTKSTNGVGGATMDYFVNDFKIVEVQDCDEIPIDMDKIYNFDVFRNKLEKILVDLHLPS